jgi:hypothetical protein
MVSAVLPATAATETLASACLAVADAGPPAPNGLPLAVESLAAGAGAAAAVLSQPDVAALPNLATGDFVTLSSPGHPLQAVQALDPPLPGTVNATFPWGLYGFQVTNVAPGGSAVVTLVLPADAHPISYYKTDPATGQLTPFPYDGQTGAEINGNVITLHLQDGGPGESYRRAFPTGPSCRPAAAPPARGP